MSNNFKLQIRHHSEMFKNREEVHEYISNTVKYDSLIGEPTMFLYGENSKSPNVLLAFGAGDKNIALIDIANVEEGVTILNEKTSLTEEQLNNSTNILYSALEACGLVLDENKITDKVSYQPNKKDSILMDASSLSEGLALLSEYVQEHVKEKNLIALNSKTITLSYLTSDSGMELSATVNISSHGEDDNIDSNNNIIGVKSDGLYATTDLNYDSQKHTLTFITSGVKNGTFVDDAKVKIIELGEHSEYHPLNDNHTIDIKINKIDESNSNISADAKLSEDIDNILVQKDGKLLVSGVSKNIKFKDTTVEDVLDENIVNINNLSKELNNEIIRAVASEEGLNTRINTAETNIQNNNTFIGNVENSLNNFKDEVESTFNEQNLKIQEIVDNDIVQGVETNSISILTTKGINNKGHIIKGNVLLSNDKSIIVSDGGLSANISVDIDVHQNKLYLNVGNKVIEKDLPGVNLIDNIVYDQKTSAIIITFANGSTATIPVDDLLSDYTFNPIDGEPVVVEGLDNLDGSINIVTRLNLRSDDNLLGVENGKLFVSKSFVENSILSEKQRAESQENEILQALNSEISTRTAEDNELKQKTLTLSDGLNNEITRAQKAEEVLQQNINTVESNLTQTINTNKVDLLKLLSDEVVRANNEESAIKELIKTQTERVDNNLSSISTLQEKTSNIDNSVKVLNGGVETAGSVLNIVTHAYNDAIEESKSYTDINLTTKANVVDVYSKTEIDSKHFATKEEVATKADIEDIYTKYEIDDKNFVRTTDVYLKNETDEKFITKDNAALIYSTKVDVQNIDSKIDSTKNELNTNLINVENSINTYITSVENALNSHKELSTQEFDNINEKYNTLRTDVEKNITSLQGYIKEESDRAKETELELNNSIIYLTSIVEKLNKVPEEIAELKTRLNVLETRLETFNALYDTDIVTALSRLSGIKSQVFTDGIPTLTDDSSMKVDMGEY